jgi:hypothetical protein
MMKPVRGEDESQIEVIDPGEPDAHQTEQERRDKEQQDLCDLLPPKVQGDNDNEDTEQLYNQFQMEDDEEYELDKIVDHVFKDGVLILKIKYQGESMGEHILDVPFAVLKKDVPLELAKYVRYHVLDRKRNGFYNQWANKRIKTHTRCIKCLYQSYNINCTLCVNRTRAVRNRMSMKSRNARVKDRMKYNIQVPNNTREALLLDKKNNNTKWVDSNAKEMSALD